MVDTAAELDGRFCILFLLSTPNCGKSQPSCVACCWVVICFIANKCSFRGCAGDYKIQCVQSWVAAHYRHNVDASITGQHSFYVHP